MHGTGVTIFQRLIFSLVSGWRSTTMLHYHELGIGRYRRFFLVNMFATSINDSSFALVRILNSYL